MNQTIYAKELIKELTDRLVRGSSKLKGEMKIQIPHTELVVLAEMFVLDDKMFSEKVEEKYRKI